MAAITLKSLHSYLTVLENASELKRRLPAASNPKTLKEGLYETSKLLGADESIFKDAQTIAALIGTQRFIMIWGEPSVTEHVARVFDSSRLLLTALINPTHSGNAPFSPNGATSGAAPQQGGAMAARSGGWVPPKSDATEAAHPKGERDTSLDDLKTLLSGNTPLACRLFRALFEHTLGFASASNVPQGSVSLVNDLTGSKEHSRSFLSTAFFILGTEVDPDNLISFMVQRGLFGMSIFEHLLQKLDYCEAFHSFRRLGRAFIGAAASEEEQLRQQLDKFNARFGGKPCGKRIFEADEQDKAKVDAYLAATDLLEAMVLTPWCMSLNKAVSLAASNSIRSVSVIASHFERFSRGEITKERANQEIADHLLAFARQFSADTNAASHPEQMISETDEKEIIQTAEQETKASKGITFI